MVGLLSLEEESDLALLRLFPQPLPPYKATVAVRDSLRLELPSSSHLWSFNLGAWVKQDKVGRILAWIRQGSL